MIEDWRKAIAIAFLVRQKVSEVDGGLWPFHLPEIAATAEQVSQIERELGEPLASGFRAFLLHANGWSSFCQANDLFGTKDLIEGERHDQAKAELKMLEPLEDVCGLESKEVIVIGASIQSTDLFLLARETSRKPGQVFWVAGQLIESFPHFEEFFLAMVDYNRNEVRHFAPEK